MVRESTQSVKQPTRKNPKIEKTVANKCRKHRLFINNKETVQKLKKWFGCVRKTYNWALESIKERPNDYKINTMELRKHFVTKAAIPKEKEYLLECPKHVRDGALDDLVTAYKANFTVKKKDPNHTFQIKFRSLKEGEAAITIPSSAIKLISEGKELSMYPTYLQNVLKLKTRNKDARDGKALSRIAYDCKLVLDRLGRFYLVVPIHQPPVAASDNQGGERWAALDPGCRTFQTAYSPEPGVMYKLGDRDASRLFRLALYLDKLPDTKRKRKEKLRLRIKHLVDEVHWKAIRFLLNRFDHILIPTFEVQNMVKKAERKITKKTVRNMLSWRHYTFRQRLMTKGSQEGKSVYVVGEEYTTRTCSNCFRLHHGIGGAKTFCCPHCGLKMDRDGMGSRNIFLKNISVTGS
jgi:putative transposase